MISDSFLFLNILKQFLDYLITSKQYMIQNGDDNKIF